jgi:hypothetical protein
MAETNGLPDAPDVRALVDELQTHDTQALIQRAADALVQLGVAYRDVRAALLGELPDSVYVSQQKRIRRLETLLTSYDPNWRVRE